MNMTKNCMKLIMSTDDLQSATSLGRLMNTGIFEFLSAMVRLVSDTLPAFMQAQLDDFNEKKAAIHLSFAENHHTSFQDGGAHCDSGRVRDVEFLLAEEKFNRKLLRHVRLYGSYLAHSIEHEKRIPICSTEWVYRDFPRNDDDHRTKELPATHIVEYIFERCSLREDRFAARVVWDAEQESKWHKTVVPIRRVPQPPEYYQPISEQYLNPSGHLADQDVFIGQSDRPLPSRDIPRGYGALAEPELPEMLRKLFGNRIPSTEELRQAVTNHKFEAPTEQNRVIEKEDAVTRADKLVEAAIASSRRKRDSLDTPLACPKTPRPDDHVTPDRYESMSKSKPRSTSKSKSKSTSKSDKRSKRKPSTCTELKNLNCSGLCNYKIKSECTGGDAYISPPKTPAYTCTPAYTPRTPVMNTTGSHVMKKEHVTDYAFPVDDGIPSGPLASNVRKVEGSCYSDCIY